LATYNGAAYLQQQLDSFATQMRLPDELVVTDDGSVDSTIEMIENFAKSAPFPIRVHRNAYRLNFSANFERAMSLCSGDVVFFSDQDDVWLPQKLAVVEQQFVKNSRLQVVINDALITDATLNNWGKTARGNIRRALIPEKMFLTGCCSAHRKSWQKIALPLPRTPTELTYDVWVNSLAVELGCALQLEETLQLQRRHTDTTSDWTLINPRGASVWQVQRAGICDARDSWRTRILILQEMVNRARAAEGLVGDCEWQAQISRIEREIAAVGARIDLCSKPRLHRSLQIPKFWLSGGYEAASGWKSALKDLIRP
jgi:glycosyltransferase involved in cell wall biosynthesis